MSAHAADAARLRVENETLHAECGLLRVEAARLATLNRKLEAQLAEAERERLGGYVRAVERGRVLDALYARLHAALMHPPPYRSRERGSARGRQRQHRCT
ncbi:MAG: hypothetical protein ACXW31_09655 [Thermoanaerobaculia bacterium]